MQTMMATCFLLLLVAALASSRSLQIAKRDVGHRLWTTSASFTECSAICGAGFQIRSVRCLDEDGVITSDCSPEDRPSNYKYCNQINCTTGEADGSLYPDFGTYTFNGAVLKFQLTNPTHRRISLVVMESDHTQTTVEVTITPSGTFTSIGIVGAVNSINFVRVNGITHLSIMEENIFEVSDEIEDFHVSSTEGIVYRNSTLSGLDGNSLIADLPILYFCDEFRVYQFEGNKVNSVHGPGTLFFSPASMVATYFATSDTSTLFNVIASYIEAMIHAEEPGSEEPGSEEPGSEEPGSEEPGGEEPGSEEPESEESETHSHATRSHAESGDVPLSTDHHETGESTDHHENGDSTDHHENGDSTDHHENGDSTDHHENGDSTDHHENGDSTDHHESRDLPHHYHGSGEY